MPDVFNDYFANIGFNLNSNFNQCNNDNISMFPAYNVRTAFFKPISPTEILEIVNYFKNNTSAGFDGVDVKVIKKIIQLYVNHCVQYSTNV